MPRIAAEETGGLSWAEIALVCQGLGLAHRSLRGATGPVTAAYDLGPRGASILNLIEDGPVNPRDLAATFKIGRSLITAELVRLTVAGLISTRAGADDRRRSELTLTPLGLRASGQVRAGIAAIITTNLAAYSVGEVQLFARMLRDARGDGPPA